MKNNKEKEDLYRQKYARDDGPIYNNSGWQGWEKVIVLLMVIGLLIMACGTPVLGVIFF